MNSTNSGRRKLLKSLTVGGAAAVTAKSMPEEWTKPLVNGVSLPAHAQTTVPPVIPDFHGGSMMTRLLTDLSAPEQIFKNIIDSVVPPALACVCKNVNVVIQQCCAKPSGSKNQTANVRVAFLIERDVDGEGVNVEHWGALAVPVDGSTVNLAKLSGGTCLGASAKISIDETNSFSKGTIELVTTAPTTWSADYIIPRGNQPLPPEVCPASSPGGSEGGGK